MNYTSVTDLKWVNAEHTILECTVDFEDLGPTPFGASDADSMPYAVSILASARTGEFGPITAYTAPVVPAPTQAQVIAVLTKAIQSRLDAFARTRNYDNIMSACTYATSTVTKFATEAQYCVESRDATWSAAYTVLAEVEAGTRPIPSEAELLAELPTLAWPV